MCVLYVDMMEYSPCSSGICVKFDCFPKDYYGFGCPVVVIAVVVLIRGIKNGK